MINIKNIIDRSMLEKRSWDIDENREHAREDAMESIPGRIILCTAESVGSDVESIIGQFICYAARRSLACWFLYCDDTKPLVIIDNLIDRLHNETDSSWKIDSSWFQAIRPSLNGVRINDCRAQDTYSSSTSASYSAKYLSSRDLYHAIVSLCYSLIAFEISPCGNDNQYERYMDWLSDYALPIAIQQRKMTYKEQWAYSSFEIPAVMRET